MRVIERTSRSPELGCDALAGGDPVSSRLNPRRPADADRLGTKRSEETVGRLPPVVFVLGVVGVDIPPIRVLNPLIRRPRAAGCVAHSCEISQKAF